VDIITLDFETYYDKQYSLSKMTTEAYIRDPRFQVIGVSTKINDGPTEWFTGTAMDTVGYLHQFDWENSALLAQNTMFDGAILSWRCGIRPKALFDTMCMSRAISGLHVRHSLAALSERWGVGQKGDEVIRAIGMRRQDFSPQAMRDYAAYCVQDTELTWAIFNKMLETGFPQSEMRLIDLTLRMFTDPVLELDVDHLQGHLEYTLRRKEALLEKAGITDKKDLMSNNKFAGMLEDLGVTPPKKISPTTGKETYAFAKTDLEFLELQEHGDLEVQTLVAARLGNKSTIEETRTQSFIEIGERGALPIPLRYYAAHTGRWGGSQRVNVQNLPSRGANAGQIKTAILAPEGYVLIDCDSSQIEARVLAWLAEQNDLVDAFARKEDTYIRMAAQIFGIPEAEVTRAQRAVGKTVILGCGYGVGWFTLQGTLKRDAGQEVSDDEARRIIDIYRHSNHKIRSLWRAAQNTIRYMEQGDSLDFGRPGVLGVDASRNAVVLPNGLAMFYPELHAEQGEKGYEYFYKSRTGKTRLYGGKLVENATQALARIIVGEQMLRIAKRYQVVLTVHDSVVSCVPEDEADEARAYIETCMQWTPEWAEGLPVACEAETGRSYGVMQ